MIEYICSFEEEYGFLVSASMKYGEELIRCKDCQHWCEEDHVCGLRDCYGWDYKPDSFCSWAERKMR